MKALRNDFRFFEPRGICHSSSFVGGSGSSYGSSSSGGGIGGSGIAGSILGSIAFAGENIALSQAQESLNTRPAYAPVNTPTVVAGLSGGSSTWIVVLIVAVIAFFAVREL
jgi:hypothetical protein